MKGVWHDEKDHCQQGHRPVSYTHLDVYKRQHLDGAAAAERVDLKIEGGVHPVAGGHAAGLGHGGEEDAVTLGAALGQAQLQVPVLAHVCLLYTSRCV